MSFIFFIGHFYSYANGSCQKAWISNQDLKEKLSPQIVKKMFERFYIKIEDIVPDIDITELKISQDIFIPESIRKNKYTLASGVEVTMLEMLPEPHPSIISDAVSRITDQLNNQYYLTGKWRGEKVFLKKIRKLHGEEELSTLRTLGKIGIPILFKGVVKNTNGALYIVNIFQDSPLFKSEEAAFKSFNVQYHELIRQQLDRIYFLFSEYGIFPRDFQFMVSKKGKVYVVDTEFYMFLGEKTEKKQFEELKGEKEKTGIILNVAAKLRRILKK